MRNNILLFAEHFLNPYTVIRPGWGEGQNTYKGKALPSGVENLIRETRHL